MNTARRSPFLLRLAVSPGDGCRPSETAEYDCDSETLRPPQGTSRGAACVIVGTFSSLTKANSDPTSDEQTDR